MFPQTPDGHAGITVQRRDAVHGPFAPEDWENRARTQSAHALLDTILLQCTATDTLRFRFRCDSLPRGGYALVTQAIQADCVRQLSRWVVRHPVFRIRIGDVNGDGMQDLCVGLIKATRHDPVERKRLFVYSLRDGHIRPLWLGSFLGRAWRDFTLVESGGTCQIETITARQSRHEPSCMRWRWQAFGFTFVPCTDRIRGAAEGARHAASARNRTILPLHR